MLSTALATDQKWPLGHFHTSCQSSKFSGQRENLIFFLGLHIEKGGFIPKTLKNPGDERKKKSRCAGPENFLRSETNLNFTRPWFSKIKVQIKRPKENSSVICRYVDHKKQYYIFGLININHSYVLWIVFWKRLAHWLKGSLCTIWWASWWSKIYYSKHTIHLPHDFSF